MPCMRRTAAKAKLRGKGTSSGARLALLIKGCSRLGLGNLLSMPVTKKPLHSIQLKDLMQLCRIRTCHAYTGFAQQNKPLPLYQYVADKPHLCYNLQEKLVPPLFEGYWPWPW